MLRMPTQYMGNIPICVRVKVMLETPGAVGVALMVKDSNNYLRQSIFTGGCANAATNDHGLANDWCE